MIVRQGKMKNIVKTSKSEFLYFKFNHFKDMNMILDANVLTNGLETQTIFFAITIIMFMFALDN